MEMKKTFRKIEIKMRMKFNKSKKNLFFMYENNLNEFFLLYP